MDRIKEVSFIIACAPHFRERPKAPTHLEHRQMGRSYQKPTFPDAE